MEAVLVSTALPISLLLIGIGFHQSVMIFLSGKNEASHIEYVTAGTIIR